MNMFVSAAHSSRSKDATGGVVRGMGFGGGERSHSARRTRRALDDVLFAFVRDRKYVILQFMRNEVEPTIWSVHYMLMPNLYAMRYHIARWRRWRRRCRSRVAAVEEEEVWVFFFLSFVIVYICWLSASAVAQLDGQWLTIVHTVWAASHLNGVLFNNVLVCHVGA